MIPQLNARAVAQAVELVRALHDQLHEMTRQLVWFERRDVAGTTGRAAIRSEAAALRRDINEAQFLIDELERLYLNSDGHVQPRLSEQARRSSVVRLQQRTRSTESASG